MTGSPTKTTGSRCLTQNRLPQQGVANLDLQVGRHTASNQAIVGTREGLATTSKAAEYFLRRSWTCRQNLPKTVTGSPTKTTGSRCLTQNRLPQQGVANLDLQVGRHTASNQAIVGTREGLATTSKAAEYFLRRSWRCRQNLPKTVTGSPTKTTGSRCLTQNRLPQQGVANLDLQVGRQTARNQAIVGTREGLATTSKAAEYFRQRSWTCRQNLPKTVTGSPTQTTGSRCLTQNRLPQQAWPILTSKSAGTRQAIGPSSVQGKVQPPPARLQNTSCDEAGHVDRIFLRL